MGNYSKDLPRTDPSSPIFKKYLASLGTYVSCTVDWTSALTPLPSTKPSAPLNVLHKAIWVVVKVKVPFWVP